MMPRNQILRKWECCWILHTKTNPKACVLYAGNNLGMRDSCIGLPHLVQWRIPRDIILLQTEILIPFMIDR